MQEHLENSKKTKLAITQSHTDFGQKCCVVVAETDPQFVIWGLTECKICDKNFALTVGTIFKILERFLITCSGSKIVLTSTD